MKKRLLIGLAALTALTITSCQKDQVVSELPQEHPITFGTYLGRDAQTKATVMDLAGLKSSDGFGVYAYYTTGDYVPASSPANFMRNQKVNYETSAWKYDPLKYWPDFTSNKLTFIAYAPYFDESSTPSENITGVSTNITTGTGSELTTTSHLGDPTLTFTVASEVEDQIDLLYASAITINEKPDNNTVPLNFNHALSRIGFAVKADRSTNKITVNSITLTGNFNTSGTMNINTGEFTSVTPRSANYSLSFNNSSNKSVEGTTAADITPDEGYIMTIPKVFGTPEGYTGSTNSDNITISVNYTIEVADGNLASGYAPAIIQTKTGTISNINFVKGNAYKIQMTISPVNEIKFDATVTDWPTENTVNFPSN